MAAGEAIGCFGLTEPDFGSNPAGMRTSAGATATTGCSNGTKMWITNGSVADVAMVWARTDDGGTAGIRGFLVPTDTPGSPPRRSPASCRCGRRSPPSWCWRTYGCRPTPCCPRRPGSRAAVVPERGPVRHRLRRAGRGPGLPGDGDRLRGDPRGLRPAAGSFQLTQAKLADMALELQKGFLLALHLGRLKDDHRLRPEQVSLGKLNNVREALDIARRVPHHPRRQRHHPGVSGAPARQQPGVRADLRGHLRGAPARDRPGPHRRRRLQLTGAFS